MVLTTNLVTDLVINLVADLVTYILIKGRLSKGV